MAGDDVYPTNHRQRAQVDWYLNFHHRNVREASVGLVAPRIRKDLDIPAAKQQAAVATLTAALVALDSGWLANTRYLVGDSAHTCRPCSLCGARAAATVLH